MLAANGDVAGGIARLAQPLATWDPTKSPCPLNEPSIKQLHAYCLLLGTPKALEQV